MTRHSVLYCILLQPIRAIELLQKILRFQRNTKNCLAIAEFAAINGKHEGKTISSPQRRKLVVYRSHRIRSHIFVKKPGFSGINA
jgi:hypothetical protein